MDINNTVSTSDGQRVHIAVKALEKSWTGFPLEKRLAFITAVEVSQLAFWKQRAREYYYNDAAHVVKAIWPETYGKIEISEVWVSIPEVSMYNFLEYCLRKID